MIPAKKSCTMMSREFPAPMSFTSPYIPAITYATASPRHMSIPKSFCAPLKSVRSSLRLVSTSMIFEPARSCITMPEVMIGEIPSSMSVPRFEAMITRIQ
jgi:hypothetical protein